MDRPGTISLTQEDDAIMVLVKEYGPKKWKNISEELVSRYKLPFRSGKQIRERYVFVDSGG